MARMVLARIWPISSQETRTQIKKALSELSIPTTLNDVAILPTITSYRDPTLGECAHPWLAEAVVDHFRQATNVADIALVQYESEKMSMRLAFKTTGYEKMAGEKGIRIVSSEELQSADMGVLLYKPSNSLHSLSELELGFLKQSSIKILIADFLVSPGDLPKVAGGAAVVDDPVLLQGLLSCIYQNGPPLSVNDTSEIRYGLNTEWIRRHYLQKKPSTVASGNLLGLLRLYARITGDVLPPVLQGW